MVETVVDSRVAQLEAALAEISQREQGHLRALDAALTRLNKTLTEAAELRAQVATLHAENARLQEENETLTAQNIALTEDAALCIESSSFHEAALSIKSLHEQVATLHQEQARLTEALEEAQYQPEFWAVLRIVNRERDEALAAIEAVRAYLDPAKWTRASEQGQGVLALLPASPPEPARAEEPINHLSKDYVNGVGALWNSGHSTPASPTPTKEPTLCHICGKPATCIGLYEYNEEDAPPLPACDDCCAHGNEDGWCKPIGEYVAAPPPTKEPEPTQVAKIAAEMWGDWTSDPLPAAPPPTEPATGRSGLELVAKERARQVERWTLSHDDSHTDGSLAVAAAIFACEGTDGEVTWPDYHSSWMMGLQIKFERADRIRQLEIAGALIVAEIERLQRAAPVSPATKEPIK